MLVFQGVPTNWISLTLRASPVVAFTCSRSQEDSHPAWTAQVSYDDGHLCGLAARRIRGCPSQTNSYTNAGVLLQNMCFSWTDLTHWFPTSQLVFLHPLTPPCMHLCSGCFYIIVILCGVSWTHAWGSKYGSISSIYSFWYIWALLGFQRGLTRSMFKKAWVAHHAPTSQMCFNSECLSTPARLAIQDVRMSVCRIPLFYITIKRYSKKSCSFLKIHQQTIHGGRVCCFWEGSMNVSFGMSPWSFD